MPRARHTEEEFHSDAADDRIHRIWPEDTDNSVRHEPGRFFRELHTPRGPVAAVLQFVRYAFGAICSIDRTEARSQYNTPSAPATGPIATLSLRPLLSAPSAASILSPKIW